MPLTSAEKQRRYKEKLKRDPEKYEEYKKKKREDYHRNKRLVKDLTPKERHNARVIWKLRKTNLRQRKIALNRVLDITPPSSPSILHENNVPLAYDDNTDTDVSTPDSPNVMNENKRDRGRMKVRKDRSKLYRENLQLIEENKQLKKKCEKFRKRCQRNLILKPQKEKDKSEKYDKLTNAIKERYKKLKKMREKNMFKNVLDNIDSSMRKDIVNDTLGLKSKIRTTVKVRDSATLLKKRIEDFFLRDDISRATAGKKETKTKDGIKVQKRFLLDNMKALFKTFKQETNTNCSYYYFTRNRPFYIVMPSVDGREMCLCKTHTNPAYKAIALRRKQAINTEDMNTLISATVCDTKSQACMYGTCKACGDRRIVQDTSKDKEKIQWEEWGRVEEKYEKDGTQFKTFKNVKQNREGTIQNLMKTFNEELKTLKKHIFKMKVQYKSYRQAIDNIQMTEVVVVVDFSENYSCKYHEEIQAHHFGGSRKQVSLHTVVVYIPDIEKTHKTESYCTVSSCTNHKPGAIWAHLDPVLKNIRNNNPEIDTIHFYSDGPFSQYRQKQNFYLSSTRTFDYGFKKMSWSFFEAGHGKGPADGVGGYLKRTADEIVARGEDISSAETFYEKLKSKSKIKLYWISNDDIEGVSEQLPVKIAPLVGTLNVHQIFTDIPGEIKYRNLSCFCKRGFCECMQPKTYKPLASITKNATRNSVSSDIEDIHSDAGNDKEDNFTSSIRDDNHNDKVPSSDEDIPLICYINVPQTASPLKEISVKDLCQTRKINFYDVVYNNDTPNLSEDEQFTSIADSVKPTTSADEKQSTSSQYRSENKENQAVRRGDYLLVNVHGTKAKIYKYACVVDDLDDDGELRVTFMRSVKNKRMFRLDKNDVADIDYTDIVKILSKPVINEKRGQLYYEFKDSVEVSEK